MAKRAATSKKKPVDLSIEHRVVLLKGKERFLMGLHTDSLIAKLREAKGDIEVIRFDGDAWAYRQGKLWLLDDDPPDIHAQFRRPHRVPGRLHVEIGRAHV